MKEPNDAKGSPKLDRKNSDEAKRKHPLLGLQLIDMKVDDDHWKGTVYNPENGKTYSATLKILNKNEVELEGCVAYVLCGDQKWTREEPRSASVTPATSPRKSENRPSDASMLDDGRLPVQSAQPSRLWASSGTAGARASRETP